MGNIAKLVNLMDKKRALILLVLCILTFSIRMYLTLDEYHTYGTRNWSDAINYMRYGNNFAAGNFYPSIPGRPHMIVGPVVPSLVALSERIFGDPILPILILNCLLGALLVPILFALGRKVVSIAAGYWMALWGAFHFGQIRFGFQILKEPIIFFLLPLIILCFLNVFKGKKPYIGLVSSALLFLLLIHTDERFFVYTPIILLILLLGNLEMRERLKMFGLWLLILLVGMVPWTLRNYKQHGQLVILTPRTTALTSRFWGKDLGKLAFSREGGIQSHSGYETAVESARLAASKEGVTYREYGKYEKYGKAFWHYWKPTYFKLNFIQYGFRGVKWSLGHNLTSLFFYGLYLPFYLAGFALAAHKRRRLLLVLAGLPLMHSLVHALMVWPLERYRTTMDFLVVLVALWFASELGQIRKEKLDRRRLTNV